MVKNVPEDSTVINLYALISFPQTASIAVSELEGAGISESDLAGLSSRLRTTLFQTGKFNVMERSRVDEILREQGFQQTGCTNASCAVEVGQLIGVEYIVIGKSITAKHTIDI